MHLNNFDCLRTIFAVFVIITHSFLLTLGPGHENDWLGEATKGQINFSTLGLAGFFSISGYLIFISMKKSKTIMDYYRNRLLRILPGLFVVLVVTALSFVLLSSFPFIEYFTSADPYRYVFYNFNLFTAPQKTILDTIKNHPFPDNINSSLWTIRYEFLFYIGTSLLFFIRHKKTWLKGLLLTAFIFCWMLKFFLKVPIMEPYTLLGNSGFTLFFICHFALYFISGALLAVYHIERFRFPNALLLGSIVVVICALDANIFPYISGIFVPIIILLIGVKSTPGLRGWSKMKWGDPSYGIYLYGFPIQQVLMHYFDLGPVALMLTAAPLAIFAGLLSYYLVEKKALKLKDQFKLRVGVASGAV